MCGPFGAVKEQAAGLYAQTMAERGFLTMAFDPSFTGESGGQPRYMASPDINTEDFQAAVDYLSLREDVDPEKIGIIGICGWGGMALNAQRTKDYQNGSYALAGGVAEEVPEDAPFYAAPTREAVCRASTAPSARTVRDTSSAPPALAHCRS